MPYVFKEWSIPADLIENLATGRLVEGGVAETKASFSHFLIQSGVPEAQAGDASSALVGRIVSALARGESPENAVLWAKQDTEKALVQMARAESALPHQDVAASLAQGGAAAADAIAKAVANAGGSPEAQRAAVAAWQASLIGGGTLADSMARANAAGHSAESDKASGAVAITSGDALVAKLSEGGAEAHKALSALTVGMSPEQAAAFTKGLLGALVAGVGGDALMKAAHDSADAAAAISSAQSVPQSQADALMQALASGASAGEALRAAGLSGNTAGAQALAMALAAGADSGAARDAAAQASHAEASALALSVTGSGSSLMAALASGANVDHALSVAGLGGDRSQANAMIASLTQALAAGATVESAVASARAAVNAAESQHGDSAVPLSLGAELAVALASGTNVDQALSAAGMSGDRSQANAMIASLTQALAAGATMESAVASAQTAANAAQSQHSNSAVPLSLGAELAAALASGTNVGQVLSAAGMGGDRSQANAMIESLTKALASGTDPATAMSQASAAGDAAGRQTAALAVGGERGANGPGGEGAVTAQPTAQPSAEPSAEPTVQPTTEVASRADVITTPAESTTLAPLKSLADLVGGNDSAQTPYTPMLGPNPAANILAALSTSTNTGTTNTSGTETRAEIASAPQSFLPVASTVVGPTLPVITTPTVFAPVIIETIATVVAAAITIPVVNGRVVDGPIAGATVFVDKNDNHILDAGEYSTISDALGNFSIPVAQAALGRLVSVGGHDITNALPFIGTMTAPVGATMLTPLTTLVDTLMTQNGLSANAAQDVVRMAFSLAPTVDLIRYDPIPGVISKDSGAVSTLSAAVSVQTTVSLISAVLQTNGAATGSFQAGEAAMAALANQLIQTHAPISLSNVSTVKSIFISAQTAAAQTTSGTAAQALLSANAATIDQYANSLAQIIADSNTLIQANTVQAATDPLKTMAAVTMVAEGATLDALKELGHFVASSLDTSLPTAERTAAQTNLTNSITFASKYTGGGLSAVVSTAQTAIDTNQTSTTRAPPIAINHSVTTNEDTPITVAVLTGSSDPGGDTLTLVSLKHENTNGVISVTDGQAIFDPRTLFDYLAAGATATDSFGYVVVNNAGQRASGVVTVTITGVNDAPTLIAGSATAVLVEAGGVNNANLGTSVSSITLTKGDVDGVASYDTAWLTGQGWGTTNTGVTYTNTGTYGVATLTVATGVVSYALSNTFAATEALTSGQSVTDSFAVQVTDGLLSQTANAVFTIQGANDAPVVAAALTSTANKGASSLTLNLLSGARDPDTGDTLAVTNVTYSVGGTATGNSGADLPGGVTLTGSSLSVNPADTAFSGLIPGQSSVIVANYTISDGHGGTVAQTETVTITGSFPANLISDSTYLAAGKFK
ncbi:MAG: VCBS domain-containing protein, partial [Rhodospirillaceae bacterium]